MLGVNPGNIVLVNWRQLFSLSVKICSELGENAYHSTYSFDLMEDIYYIHKIYFLLTKHRDPEYLKNFVL